MHTHVWRHFNQDIPFLCRLGDCAAQLTWEEAERRLNAVEMLPVEKAKEIIEGVLKLAHFVGDVIDDDELKTIAINPNKDLLAYASILEGETT